MNSFPQTDYHTPRYKFTIDYYPFGQEMQGLVYNATDYRFGFNNIYSHENEKLIKLIEHYVL